MRLHKAFLAICFALIIIMTPSTLLLSADLDNREDLLYPQFPGKPGISDVSLLGSAVFAGDYYDILYLNGYLWIADGKQYYSGNLKTFDISDPENPALIAGYNLPKASAFRLEGDGNRLFVAAKDRGIFILDVTDPLNPVCLGKYQTQFVVNDMDVLGDMLCVLKVGRGLLLLDISDPRDIRTISQTAVPGSINSLAVTEDSLLTIASGTTGLLFYSIADPETPQYLGEIELSQKGFTEVVCQDDLAYAIYRKTWLNDGGFAVVDLSNSPDFTILSENKIFGVEALPECGLDIEGDTLFVAGTQGGMGVWDVSDPQAPSRYGGYGGAFIPGVLMRWPTRVTYGGGYAYTIAPDRFNYPGRNEACVVDISDLTDPHPVGIIDPPDWIRKAVGSGDYAYVASSTDGLIVVDISSPGEPVISKNMDVFNIYFNASELLYEDGLVYATGGNQGLAVISVEDPTDPQLIGQFLDWASDRRGIDKQGDLVAVTGSAVNPAPPGWLLLLDVSTPTNPQLVAFVEWDVNIFSVDLVGRFAVVGFADGMGIFDISDPFNPTMISETSTGSGSNDVVVSGSVAFAGDRSSNLVILDVSDPFNPVQISTLPTPGVPLDMELNGNILYIANDLNMLVVDVSDVNNPVITDIVKVNGSAEGVSYNDGLIFLCDRYGFHILSD
jgi:hypothetical protein